MPYKVEVTAITTKRGVRREWQRIRSAGEATTEESPEFGYVEDRAAIVEDESKVYEQTVDELNLSAVIRAVNNMQES